MTTAALSIRYSCPSHQQCRPVKYVEKSLGYFGTLYYCCLRIFCLLHTGQRKRMTQQWTDLHTYPLPLKWCDVWMNCIHPSESLLRITPKHNYCFLILHTYSEIFNHTSSSKYSITDWSSTSCEKPPVQWYSFSAQLSSIGDSHGYVMCRTYDCSSLSVVVTTTWWIAVILCAYLSFVLCIETSTNYYTAKFKQ